jgi:hypothetical protein
MESVVAASAITPPGEVRFREERHNPMLKEPMVLTGTLEYVEPGVLRKSVETPFQEKYLVEAAGITIESEGEVRVLPVRQGQMIQGFLAGVEALLAGDAERLVQDFDHCLKGAADDWTLQLKPRKRRLARHLEAMLVRGGEGMIRSIRVDLGDDEWQVMEILPPAGAPGS